MKKLPFGEIKKPIGPPQVTARDPITGMKATGSSRFSATNKLEIRVGKKVPNPIVTRS